MKQPLWWHKECLVNMRSSLADRRAYADRVAAGVRRLEGDVEFAERQIAEAEKRGLDAFDGERLLKPRRKGS
jgi:hypothetical protein